jgi:ABC-2 type transport system ATP-binding protein
MIEVATPKELGGRAAAQSVVHWKSAEGPQSLATPSPTKAVMDLSEHFGGEVPELRVIRPSLEDIYLSMIGDSQ